MDLPAPMLPVPGPPPAEGGWSYEREHGGVRVVCGAHDGRWRMLTRYGTDLADRFPELGGIADLRGTALDGELVLSPTAARRLYTDPADAARLADAYPAAVAVFDVLALNGVDVRHEPYIYRRIVLDSLGLGGDNWCTRPWTSDPPATPQGALAKRLDSPYLSGRSRRWRRLHPARPNAEPRPTGPRPDFDESRLRPVW
ncbi:hypothetical protein ACFQS3_11510 [Glycomyces mayteni]|uniref:ATP-dependent DNA ligase family profile domain-containing protein n=1 Tax=Glycomyces mayteni TaxID=543887 RepID=A0ABW2DAJ2_9ACTN|nr:hypothetical protein GCM10025732_33490 [Glycomyces mayteni]